MLKTKLLYMPPSKKREDNLPLWLHPLSSLFLPLTVNVTPVSARLLSCYCYLNPISISQPSIKLFSLTIILPQIILYTSSPPCKINLILLKRFIHMAFLRLKFALIFLWTSYFFPQNHLVLLIEDLVFQPRLGGSYLHFPYSFQVPEYFYFVRNC